MLLEILSKAKESAASDIHIKVGSKPFFRSHKHLYKEETLPEITENDMYNIAKEVALLNASKPQDMSLKMQGIT